MLVTGAPAPTNLRRGADRDRDRRPWRDAAGEPDPALAAYGYAADGPMPPAANFAVRGTALIEASKTEPDKNTHSRPRRGQGPDAGYDYGRHFPRSRAMRAAPRRPRARTRLSDPGQSRCRRRAHRVTLMADKTVDGGADPYVDGTA